jgi:hypothetical protein
MNRRWMVVAVVLFCSGCASAPFRPAPRDRLRDSTPMQARDRFESALPGSYQLVNSVVFQFHGFKFSSLGYLAVDASRRSFTLVGMNPAGVNLFEISGTNEHVASRFAVEGFPHQQALAAAVGQAIREMCFDRVPPAGARMHWHTQEFVFRDRGTNEAVEYFFGGSDGHLVEKRYYRGSRRWTRRIGFYDYQQKAGKLYPGTIVLHDRRYGYSLVVKLKEIR